MPDGGRPPRKLLEHARAHAEPLQPVGHEEGGLGRRGITQPHVARERDDVLTSLLHQRPDQRAASIPVRVQVALHQARRRAHGAVEAHLAARGRHVLEERQEGRRVGGHGRAQAQGLAVAQDDVEHEGRGIRHPGTVRRSCSLRTDLRASQPVAAGRAAGGPRVAS